MLRKAKRATYNTALLSSFEGSSGYPVIPELRFPTSKRRSTRVPVEKRPLAPAQRMVQKSRDLILDRRPFAAAYIKGWFSRRVATPKYSQSLQFFCCARMLRKFDASALGSLPSFAAPSANVRNGPEASTIARQLHSTAPSRHSLRTISM